MKNKALGLQSFLMLVILAGFGLTSLSACSGGSGSSSHVQIQFPDWDAKRTADLQRRSRYSSLSVTASQISIIAINVSGPGITTNQNIYWRRNLASDVPPTTASFNLTAGSSYLFQVMAVYGDQQSEFYYGETTQNVSSGSANIDITITSVAAANNGVQGQVIGRYLKADLSGPTGIYQYRFAPPSGSTPMIVTTGEAFGGWINLFALDTPLIQYTWTDGTPAFTLPNAAGTATQLSNSSNLFYRSTTLPAAARIEMPAGWSSQNSNSGVTSLSQSGAQRYVVGFFGPGAAVGSHKLCYNPTAGAPIQGYFASNSLSNPMLWGATSSSNGGAYIASVQLLDTGAITPTGTPFVNCQAATDVNYVNTLYLDETWLDQGDGILGFRGPFQSLGNGNLVSTSYNAATNVVTANWNYLPGVAASLPSVGVFYRTTSQDDSDIRSNDGYNCAGLTTLASNPLTFVGFVPTPNSTVAIPGISASQAQNMLIVVCPFDGTNYYTSAATATTNSQILSPSLVLLNANDPTQNTIVSNTCTPYRATLLDQNLNSSPTTAALSVTAMMSGSMSPLPSFYNDSTCSQTGIQTLSLTIPAGAAASPVFYIKASTSGVGTASVSLSPSGSNTEIYTQSANLYVVPAASVPTAVAFNPLQTVIGTCSPLSIGLRDSSSNPAVATAATTFTVANSNGLFYTNRNCSGLPVTSPVLPAGHAAMNLFYKPILPGYTTTSVTATGLPNASASVLAGTANVTGYKAVTQTGSLVYGLDAPACIPFYVTPTDELGLTVSVPNAVSLGVAASGGSLYSDPNCTSNLGATTQLAINSYNSQTNMPIYIRPTAGSASASLTITDQNSITGSTTLSGIHYLMTCPIADSIGQDYLVSGGTSNAFFVSNLSGSTLTSITLSLKAAGGPVTQNFQLQAYVCGTSSSLGMTAGLATVNSVALNTSSSTVVTFAFNPPISLTTCPNSQPQVGFHFTNTWNATMIYADAVTSPYAACTLDEGGSTTGFSSSSTVYGTQHTWVSTITTDP